MDEWRFRLRTLLDGKEVPSLDLLMHIDTLLAGPGQSSQGGDSQVLLFQWA